ncbi:MAG: CPBP family intramembrane glutamic endopeptidase [Pseudomonadota bacterium]|nr:CPBP family intramembrane glutamic endopeptidase [Pseudomonadota bacterium]
MRAALSVAPSGVTGQGRAMWFQKPFYTWLCIGAVGLLALAASVDLTFIKALPEAPAFPDPILRLLMVTQPFVLMAAGTALGVLLSDKVGLTSWLTARLRGEPARFPSPVLPIATGLIGGILIALADRWFFFVYSGGETPASALPGLLQGLAAITYGGIVEELMLRYGLLTLLFWAAWKLTGHIPGALTGTTLVVLVALLFGLGHLPAMAASAPLDAAIAIRTILLNAVLGVVYGWFYWRRGLEAGMMAHMASHPGLWIGLSLF